MTCFSHTDYRPHQQHLWHDPTIKGISLWRQPSYKFGSIPEPLYRVRVSVLNDNQSRDDCLARIYINPTLETLTNAINEIYDSFGGPFPKCEIRYGDPVLMAGVDDSRTWSIVLMFDTQSADESWTQFKARLEELEKRWTEETDSD